MRNCLLAIFLVGIVNGALTTVWAEPDPDRPGPGEGPAPGDHPRDGPPNASFDGMPPVQGERRGGPRDRADGRRIGRGALERWLQHMESENPEEFERLMTLREEDPEAFRQALRSRLDGLRGPNAPDGHPGNRRMQGPPRDFSPEEQRRGMEGFGRGRDGSRSPWTKDPAVTRLEQQTRRLVQACRNAPEGEERDQLVARLRANLEEIFEHRERQRSEMIERMSRKLEALREELEKRGAQRDELIDRRMEELLPASYSTTGASAQRVSRE